jgi:hypothetical protein
MSSQYWGGAPESSLDCGGRGCSGLRWASLPRGRVPPPLSPAAPGWRRLGIKAKELRAYMAASTRPNGRRHLSCQSRNGTTETRVLAREPAPPANSMRSQAASEAEALQDQLSLQVRGCRILLYRARRNGRPRPRPSCSSRSRRSGRLQDGGTMQPGSPGRRLCRTTAELQHRGTKPGRCQEKRHSDRPVRSSLSAAP